VLKPVALAAAVAIGVGLTGCGSSAPDPAADGHLLIVATTDVYADLALIVAPLDAEVVPIITGGRDPHEFEASGRDQLVLSRADIVIVNGGGYDDFMTQLLRASGNDDATVLDAVELSGLDATADGFNEHVWFDYDSMDKLISALGDTLSERDPARAADFADSVAFGHEMMTFFEGAAASIADQAGGAGVVITEPVPLYLLEACGLVNLTPPEFSEAVEDDTDIPPALLQSVLNEIGDGSASLVVYNAQTGGPQTDAVIDVATDHHVPLIAVTETYPDDTDYPEWQTGLLNEIAAALGLDPVA